MLDRLLHSPMDEEWDHFFISSFFMPSLDIASSFFIASLDIASSFFMLSLDIASSFFMPSLDIVSLAITSLPILSCANAAGVDAATSEMMTAEARSKTREALFIVLSFQNLVWNDLGRQTEYVMDRHLVTKFA